MPADAATQTPYRVKADSGEACDCQHHCNCQFAGFPSEGKSEFLIGYAVKDGRCGDVSLDGVRAVVAAKDPNAIHEGNGHVVLFIDDTATSQQADALVSILSGRMGGMPWEALAGTIGRFDGPILQSLRRAGAPGSPRWPAQRAFERRGPGASHPASAKV